MEKPFDIFVEFGKFALKTNQPINENETLKKFTDHVSSKLERILQEDTFLHGHRIQNMFEAMVVSLNNFQLLKTEDNGQCHSKSAVKVPDFRLISKDGNQFLVEVKNHFCKYPLTQIKSFKYNYIDKLRSYSNLVNSPILVAVYWSVWGLWTLVPIDSLNDDGSKYSLNMVDAMVINEMRLVGDVSIGTKPPIEIRLECSSTDIDDNDETQITIESVKVSCGSNEVTDASELDLIWLFICYGKWVERDHQTVIEDNKVVSMSYLWEPREYQNQGFEMIGNLSSMYSRYYSEKTVDDGTIVHVNVVHTPDWLKALNRSIEVKGSISLWRFIMRPAESA